MEKLNEIVSAVDGFVWGPVMLVLLVGTGIFLTIRTGFLPWRNLGYALKSTLSKEARTKSRGTGDVSPFSALTTALAATIGTGNIVGVATAMVSGGPGALVWMWISAAFGMTSKFSECMLAIKYREVNAKGEMSGGPMYTMKKAFKHKKFGAMLGWLFALFAVIASFGIGNMTQANSISESLSSTFSVPTYVTGIILTVFALLIIVGGIKTISKVSSVVVPLMAIFYVVAGLIVIIVNIQNLPAGVAMIFKMAFSVKAVGGGLCGTITAAMMNAMRFGVARSMSLTFNIINICNIDSDHTAFHIHHDNLRFPLFHPADSTVKPLGKCEIGHRLQYIIQRIHCISPDRILCHIRNENDHNLRVNFTDFFSGRHSVHKFHFHIHQDNIILGFIFIYNLIAV